MAAERKRIEVGFIGGQVVSLKIDDEALSGLRKAVEDGDGWHDLETEDGTIALDLAKIVFIRAAGSPHTIGFSGN
jgi:hypothetical protein